MMHRLLVIAVLIVAATAGKKERSAEDPDDGRIIGGLQVPDMGAPFAVYLKAYDVDGKLVRTCGGTILNTTLILTSAQCLWESATVECIAGTNDIAAGGQTVKGVGVWHTNYAKNSKENDIGLVRLQTALELNANVKLVNFPKKSKVAKDKQAGKKVTMYGWGFATLDATADSPLLNRVNMTVIKNEDCFKLMRQSYYLLPSTSFCTETLGDAVGFCKHDLGGPVMFYDTSDSPPSTYIVGIVSEYISCHSPEPNMFTSIYPFLDWIALMGGPKAA